MRALSITSKEVDGAGGTQTLYLFNAIAEVDKYPEFLENKALSDSITLPLRAVYAWGQGEGDGVKGGEAGRDYLGGDHHLNRGGWPVLDRLLFVIR